MKIIKSDEYNVSKGTLFDLEEPIVFRKKHIYGAVNVPFDKLLANYKTILDKKKSYFLYCHKGHKSKKAVSMLEYYGYDVTQVKDE